MADPFLGEIRIFAGNFAPYGWAFCNGQLLPISQNTPLFSILWTSYGGDGKTTFALPDLQGRAPMHQGEGPGLTPRAIGEIGGETTVTLLGSQMPAHNHLAYGSDDPATTSNPIGGIWARSPISLYSPNAPNTPLNWNALSQAGGNQPHNNMQPYLGLSFIIALQGVYPVRGW